MEKVAYRDLEIGRISEHLRTRSSVALSLRRVRGWITTAGVCFACSCGTHNMKCVASRTALQSQRYAPSLAAALAVPVLLILLALPPVRGERCTCNGYRSFGNLNQPSGQGHACKEWDADGVWCYVDRSVMCPDAKPSNDRRFFWSKQACFRDPGAWCSHCS